jgi:hypothetical protein
MALASASKSAFLPSRRTWEIIFDVLLNPQQLPQTVLNKTKIKFKIVLQQHKENSADAPS